MLVFQLNAEGLLILKHTFTLEYWQDDGWYVGKLKEVPGVFSQGETINELEENIEDVYRLVMGEETEIEHPIAHEKDVMVELM